MELSEQKRLVDASKTWIDREIIPIVKDNRRRYYMELADEKERKARGLSAIPSTKTTAAVDKFVESSILLYHNEPGALTYTAKAAGSTQVDEYASWLTEIFAYRAKHSFPFFTWHQSSLTAVGVDGLECNMVRWHRETYPQEITNYLYLADDGQQVPIDKTVFDLYSGVFPDRYQSVTGTKNIVSLETFWIDQLEPGVDVIWDPNIPLLDVNLGQFCLVKLRKPVSEIVNWSKAGIIDPITEEELKQYQKGSTALSTIDLSSMERMNNADLQDKNLVEVCVFFDKQDNQWGCQFSIELREKLSKRKLVNDVWFGGRQVNRLPVVIGTTKLKLWKQMGRAIPETIAPLEDQHIDHINNLSDAAKNAIQGRYRIDPSSDVDVDALLNRRVVFANDGEFSRLNDDGNLLSSLRADDSVVQGINELIPVGMAGGGRGVVPKGTEKTLGAIQLGKMEGDEKQSVAIKTRNETSLSKILYLISQLIIAFETDEEVLRKAAANAGIIPPEVTLPDGRKIIDHTALDFPVDVEINAGMGSAPRYQKAQTLQQIAGWRQQYGVPTDFIAIGRHLNTLGGFGADQFMPTAPPATTPPQVEYKLDLKMTFAEFMTLAPEAAPVLKEKLISGSMDVSTKVESAPAIKEAMQNGGGMFTPDRTGQVVDGTGPAALGMSDGGMNAQ